MGGFTMTERKPYEFLEGWVSEHVQATPFNDLQTAARLARECLDDAEKAGFERLSIIVAAQGDVPSFMLMRSNEAVRTRTKPQSASNARKIYKYASSQFIGNIFSSSENVTLKCALPKDFNDPYELFLTINFDEEPDALAFYADAIGELPQWPTTCFSRSPAVIPMWAHYAENHKGFVLEISEECLAEATPKACFGDVDYKDAPSDDLAEMLHRAFKIGKYRYTYLLNRGVHSAAYFTKLSCWVYEQERRMIVPEENTREVSGLILLDTPSKCVTSIIVGSKATKETKQTLARKAEELGCNYYEIRIGKSSAKPYFVDNEGHPYTFDNVISPCEQYCETCVEPIAAGTQCSWCRIDNEMRQDASSRNPFRILDRVGLLDSYIAGMDEISDGKRKT
jgi:hypothetical protein